MISVIIVGYNSQKYLDDCLSSLFSSTYTQFKVIFIDNNSSDDSVNFVKRKFPKVEIIESKDNLGFTGGNNLGMERAYSNGSDFVFLLNPDTIIDKDCLATLIKKADKNTILQPLILLHEKGKNTDLINTTGNYLNFLGISYCNNYRKPSASAHEEEIPTASGAAVLIPTNILKKTGMFDESFFMYHEDVDLCWRARILGFNIKLVPNAYVWHKYSFGRNNKKMFFIERNRLLFIFKNFETKTILLISPLLLVNEILMFFYSLVSGWPIQKISASIDFLRIMIKKRNRLVLTRKATDRELKKYLSGDIEFSEIKIKLLKIYSWFCAKYWKMIRSFI